jgi:hypothetical protein
MKSGENRAEDLPDPFAGNLRVIAEGDASAFEFLLTPSALYLTLYSFPVSLFRLVCFCFFTLFQNTVCTLSAGFGFRCFRPVLVRKRSLLVWGSKQNT